jgi:FAD:protein FMN transferase
VSIRTEAVMGTLVTVHVVPAGADTAMDRAFRWFHEIEACCSRFQEDSELMQLARHPGEPVPATAILFEAVRFAVSLAEETGGAFDPTVGAHMEARGYNREHRTGEIVQGPDADHGASYRDLELDADRRTITLLRPLTLDLGAVAKGLAVDLATRELAPFADFAIDAGGDLYMGGLNPQGDQWSVGIRHPNGSDDLIHTFTISNQAVCTSGAYERGDHILDGRSGVAARAVASATVVAQGAMLADALATAAFILGPVEGVKLLERMGVDGLIVTPDLAKYTTRGLRHAA